MDANMTRGPAARPVQTDLQSLAFYLPQFHRVPENDLWWGTGFTEWTHLERAQPRFPGHQIRRPIPPLGAYELLDPAVMEAQFELADSHGITGFLVWDYWLGGGRMLLDKPIAQVLSARLRFRYALAWANHSWADQLRKRRLAQQLYLGPADYSAYFDRCLQHFVSDDYIRVDTKPLFFIYRPQDLPDLDAFVTTWRELAARRGLPGLYFIGDYVSRRARVSPLLDAYSNAFGCWTNGKKLYANFFKEKLRTKLGIQTSPQRFDFSTLLCDYMPPDPPRNFIPTVFTGWDTTPRHGRNGVVLEGLDPCSFRSHLEGARGQLLRDDAAQRILLVKSWNEWAEGNLLEPDSVYGDRLLKEFGRFSSQLRARLLDKHLASQSPLSPAGRYS